MLMHPDDFGPRRHRQQASAGTAAAPAMSFPHAVRRGLVTAREADGRYWARRWLAMLRGDRRTVAEIAATEGRSEAEIRAGVDEALRAEGHAGGLDAFLQRLPAPTAADVSAKSNARGRLPQ